jgi:hypothetical protein
MLFLNVGSTGQEGKKICHSGNMKKISHHYEILSDTAMHLKVQKAWRKFRMSRISHQCELCHESSG